MRAKKRIRPLFGQRTGTRGADLFSGEGLLSNERRKTGWMRAGGSSAILVHVANNRRSLGRRDSDADA